MEVTNRLYLNQGIHVICTLFTVDKGIVKVLLIKRKNDPFKDKWALVGGALYNNEDLLEGLRREVYEKSGVKDINSVNLIKETLKTSDAEWMAIDQIKDLAYDHDEIIESSYELLKSMILKSNILASLFPHGFTMPEIQKTYEAILETKFDRRNFRRKLLSLNLIDETNEEVRFEGNKPAKLYKFKDKIEDIKVF